MSIDPLNTLFGDDLPEYDTASFDRLEEWAVREGWPRERTAGYLFGFLIAFAIREGCSEFVIRRFAGETAKLAIKARDAATAKEKCK